MGHVHISHAAGNYSSPRTIESAEKLTDKRFAKKALWIGVMPVGMSSRANNYSPEFIGLYYHTIRKGRHPAGNGLHHFRAQILEPRPKDEAAFEYEPLKTPGGVRAIVAAAATVEYLKTSLPDAWEVVVAKPTQFNPDVKDMPMPLEEISFAQHIVNMPGIGGELPLGLPASSE